MTKPSDRPRIRFKPGYQPPKRGRHKGARVSLLHSPLRFEVALLWALKGTSIEGLYPAARLTKAVLSDRPIDLMLVSNIVRGLSIDFGGHDEEQEVRGCRLDQHADYLVRRSNELMRGATGEELIWVTESSGLVQYLAAAVATGSRFGLPLVLDWLVALGWLDVALGFFRRLHAAARSNTSPVNAPLVAEVLDWLECRKSAPPPMP